MYLFLKHTELTSNNFSKIDILQNQKHVTNRLLFFLTMRFIRYLELLPQLYCWFSDKVEGVIKWDGTTSALMPFKHT